MSIAEAMITKASTQCWDNSTRGLDASTALEYVQSLRSLTNMAHVSTLVALYQAGESLYDLFDKVVLIDEGQCLYYGSTEDAAAYFEELGFARPARWTTADFVSFQPPMIESVLMVICSSLRCRTSMNVRSAKATKTVCRERPNNLQLHTVKAMSTNGISKTLRIGSGKPNSNGKTGWQKAPKLRSRKTMRSHFTSRSSRAHTGSSSSCWAIACPWGVSGVESSFRL